MDRPDERLGRALARLDATGVPAVCAGVAAPALPGDGIPPRCVPLDRTRVSVPGA